MSYDKISANYDRILAPFEDWFLDKWRAETLSYLPENTKILEIGAGTGSNFKHYPDCQHAVAGDISIKMLEVARLKTNSVNLIQADAEDLPFPDDAFDTAFATLVFCSIPKPKKAFAELQRVLKAKGKIILLEHVRPNGLLGLLFDVLNVFTVAFFADCFNRKTAEIAEESGLKIIEIKPKAFGIINLIICEVENTTKKQSV